MVQLEDVEATWELLEQENPSAEDLRVREMDEVIVAESHPLFAVDSSGHRQLLIPVPGDRKLYQDTKSSGVHITSRKMYDVRSLRQFMVVVCLKPHLNELFSFIVAEILNELLQDPNNPDIAAKRVLERWRELLEHALLEKLETIKVIGMFGELWYLRQLVRLNPNAVRYWVGPEGDRHDFGIGNSSLEVKTRLGRQGRIIVVHGHEQLEPRMGGQLILGVLGLEKTEQLGENLTDLVHQILENGGDRQMLMQRLARLGITSQVLGTCNDLRFIVRENLMYRVDNNFPRIISNSFVGGRLPAGITSLEYEVELTGEPPYPLTQQETTEFLQAFVSGMS